MRCYTITAVSCFIERPLIRAFHADMFHGLAERDGREYPSDTKVWADSPPASPLLISRTVHGIPEISRPSSHLVVSERIVTKLQSIRNIRLAPVQFKRLVDIQWQKGDMSYETKWNHPRDPLDLLRRLPDVRKFHRQIGTFFEVQTYRWQDIVGGYPSAREITVEQGTPPLPETEVIRVSSEMLRDFPMFKRKAIFVHPDIFDILDPHLDRDFFLVRRYEVD
jgi:hypothetical protein